jgi:hypothetical protein
MTTVNRNTRLICTETGEYPIFLADLSARVPGTIFPQVVAADELLMYGYEVVVDVVVPQADVVQEGKPELRDGSWYRVWNARSFTENELSSNLAQAKANLLTNIEAFRVAQFEKGFPYQVNGEIYHVQIRTTDRQNISSIRVIAKEAIAAGADLPIAYRVYENVTVNLTASEFVAMADTTFYRVTEGYQVAWVLKDQTNNATTIAELPTIPTEMFQSVENFNGV